MPAFAAPPQLDRRSRDEPEIVVEAGGRNGPCDVLRFTADGKNLLAAGDDKVIRIWPVNADGIDTDVEKLRTLRWPAWREQRGGIKTISLSPDETRVAVGGFGLRISAVAILNRESRDLLALTWPPSRDGLDHFNAVMMVAYHPDGERVAFGTADGSIFIWKPARLKQPDAEGRLWTAPARVGRHGRLNPNHGDEAFNLPRALFFQGQDTLISVAQSGEVMACDLTQDYPTTAGAAPAARVLFNVYKGLPNWYTLQQVAVVPGGEWIAAAAAGPEVLLCSMDGKKRIVLPLGKDQFPRCLAVTKTGDKLAVSVTSARPGTGQRFYMELDDKVLVYNQPFVEGNAAKPIQIAHVGTAEAMAWHPLGDRLAVAGGDADEVTLYTPGKPEQKPSVARGAGRRLWGVAISENGRTIGVQTGRDVNATHPNHRAAGDRVGFALNRLKPTKPATNKDTTWLTSIDEADGWTLVPDDKSRFLWSVRKQGRLFPIAWDRGQDQAPTCYTFLPATKTNPTTRLIVGHYYGCSLYELTNNGPVRIKLYTGHTGEVLSVAAAKDQTWFVTSGSDQTVCAWSLKDWPHQASLGASFAVNNNNELVVAAIAIGSPAYEAGLSVGDVIEFLTVGGNRSPIYDRLSRVPSGRPQDAIAAFQNATSGRELFIRYRPKDGGETRKTLTTVRQRPLWKWFPAFDEQNRLNDWVIWMWKGSFYHTDSTNGDRLVGWHVNHPDIDGKPEFYQLNQFQEQYHRRGVIEMLVNTGSVQAALEVAWGGNPQRIQFHAHEPAPVRLALENTVVNKNGVKLTVIVKQRGLNPDLLPDTVELWINDYRYRVWQPKGQALEEALTLPAELFRAGDNRLTVLTFNKAGGRAETQETVVNNRAVVARQLTGLSIGVDDYGDHRKNLAGARKGFTDLASAAQDARGLATRINDYRGDGRYFVGDGLTLKLNSDASRKSVLSSLAGLTKTAKPDDHLIVFFAGHGDLLDVNAAANGARGIDASIGDFVLCCPDYSPINPRDTAISSLELFNALAAVNCRKTVLFDACHSGRAADANLIRRFIPNGQGPTVIAACDQSEFSYEHPDPKVGHGLFTLAILEAIGDRYRKADYNTDGVLTTEELYRYLADRVPELASQVKKGETQTPICFPRQPPRTIFVGK